MDGDAAAAERAGRLAVLIEDAADLGATEWTVARDLVAAARDNVGGELESLVALLTDGVQPTGQNAAFRYIDVPPLARTNADALPPAAAERAVGGMVLASRRGLIAATDMPRGAAVPPRA